MSQQDKIMAEAKRRASELDAGTVQSIPAEEVSRKARTLLIPHVVHYKKEPYDVYIGRPSKWGNPFSIGMHGTRKEVIALYKQYVLVRRELLLAIRAELKGKTLGCWCAPKACHGDILLWIANCGETEFQSLLSDAI